MLPGGIIKVLFLTHNFIRYKGDFAGIFLYDIAKELFRRSVRVCVVAPHDDALPDNEEIDGIEIYRFRYAPADKEYIAYRGNMHQLIAQSFFNKILTISFFLNFFKKTMAVIKTEKPDLVHAHWWIPAGIIGLATARIMRLPIILTLHGTDVRLLETYPLLKPVAQLIARNTTRVTVSSAYLKNKWISLTGIPEPAVTKMPMPVDTAHFVPYGKARSHRLMTVARLSRQKGIHYLIDACSILKTKKKKFFLDIIGDGEEMQDLQGQVRSLGLSSSVCFHGAVSHDRVQNFLGSAAICILPSIEEGFGVALLEALACHTPVIGTDSGGIREIIIDRKTGLLVPPGNPASLAEAIERLLSDRKLAERLARAGRNFVLKNFSARHIAGAAHHLYHEVLQR